MLIRDIYAVVLALAPFAQAAPIAEKPRADLESRYIYTQSLKPDGSETKRDAELESRYIYTQSLKPDGSETKRDAELESRYIYTQSLKPDGSETKRAEDDSVFHPASPAS